MSEKRANAFARCLRANKNFADATVHPTSKGSSLFYVGYLPTNAARQENIFETYQQEQIDRAVAEMDDYSYAAVPGQFHLVDVTSLPDRKGKRDTYRVDRTAHSCACPHYQFRLKVVGAVCKHIVGTAITQPPVPLFVSAVRHAVSANAAARIERDFS